MAISFQAAQRKPYPKGLMIGGIDVSQNGVPERSEKWIWTESSFPNRSDFASARARFGQKPEDAALLKSLREELLSMKRISFKSLPSQNDAVEFAANNNFNLRIFSIANKAEASPSQIKKTLLDVISKRDPAYKFAIESLAKNYDRKDGGTEFQIGEVECTSLIRRFLDRINLFEKDSSNNSSELRKDIEEVWTIVTFPLRDLLGEQNDEMLKLYENHYMRALKLFHELKPLLAYVHPGQDFTRPIERKLERYTHQNETEVDWQARVAGLLRSSAYAVVELLIDYAARNKGILLKSTET